MASVKLKLNRDRITKSGDYPVVFQIIQNRKRKLIYTGIKVRDGNFDSKRMKLVYSSDLSPTKKQISEFNAQIDVIKNLIQGTITKIEYENPNFNADDFLQHYKQDQSDKYLINYMEKQIALKLKLGKTGIANAYKYTLNSLKRYTTNKQIEFSKIDYRFVKGYEEFLQCSGVTENSISFYLRNLRTIYHKAENEGIEVCASSPFCKIKIRQSKTIKRALNKGIIRQIAMLKLQDNPQLEIARDIFMFSFYSRGMSFVDIITLKRSNIHNGMIQYMRNKTHRNMLVAITPQLQNIINKYAHDSAYVLPLIDSSNPKPIYDQYRSVFGRINRGLKQIAKLLSLDTNLTTYVARHSWATLAKEGGASVIAISEGLGHSSEKTTNIYLREFDHSVIDKINARVVRL